MMNKRKEFTQELYNKLMTGIGAKLEAAASNSRDTNNHSRNMLVYISPKDQKIFTHFASNRVMLC
jgi:hypothetical protein